MAQKNRSLTKVSLAATAAAVAGVAGFVNDIHAAIVINEVYGGGGSSATTGSFNTDFIELYNNGLTAVDLAGLSVRYASATGAFPAATSTNNNATLPTFSLAPGAFFVVSGATAATNAGPALPTADATSNINAGATAGKIALFAADGTSILDLVGYGTTATGGEGTPAPAPSLTTSVQRLVDGLDTNVNSVDFAARTPTFRASNLVPEPTTLGLAAVSSALLVRRRKSR